MAAYSTSSTQRRPHRHRSGRERLEHLVVVSDPKTLGEMPEHFHRNLRGKTIRELAKDFSRRPLEDIASLIADAWRGSGNGCRRKPVQS